ncbi:nucleotidyltransferase domain-containing protein [Corynebacterium afermentans subsp. lipophilum]|uniref:nucleotidyltransferase domain-containing protein n=1 Tax=Corynebacterium afermentans TaxID=38286 RepID=UPI001889E7C6|nr:nucleotidyltransferase domain-containing protein [Corynebacterium afermentans]MBF4546961.1 nucleotidyltransferase domain-containing protein [Corynebacterium afermentans subsp. lipophilum]WJY59321.1 Nucleotidyltransferase domain protein [Corynebacterium afermentans subsp. lipophilum]
MKLQNPFTAICSDADAAVLLALGRAPVELTAQQVYGLVAGPSLSSVRRSLERLARSGVVLERMLGQARGYSLNQQHLLAAPIREIAHATEELYSRIAQSLDAWPVSVSGCVLFGSAARGEMGDSSDIDLLILVDSESAAVQAENGAYELSRQVEAWTGVPVNVVVWTRGQENPGAIVDNIAGEGKTIYGDPQEVRGILRGIRGTTSGQGQDRAS